MKQAIIIILIGSSINVWSQVDSIEFKPSFKAEVNTLKATKISINKISINTEGEPSTYVSLGKDCNYNIPTYRQLSGESNFNFKKIKSDASASLNALGSSLSVERKSEFYVFYLTRSKSYSCNSNQNKVNYGIAVFVILKVSDLKSKVNIRTPYDISAVAQLSLASVQIDVRTFGLTPELQNEFLPKDFSNIGVKSAAYFDQLLPIVRNKFTDENIIPELLPTF